MDAGFGMLGIKLVEMDFFFEHSKYWSLDLDLSFNNDTQLVKSSLVSFKHGQSCVAKIVTFASVHVVVDELL